MAPALKVHSPASSGARWLRPFLLVLALLMAWRYVPQGPPQTELVNFLVEAFAHAAVSSDASSSDNLLAPGGRGREQVLCAIEAVASRNGLCVDHDTVSDGDCGLDALLRNLLRLQLGNPAAVQLAQCFHAKGRGSALHAMRLKLLIWIRQHANLEIVPGMTLEDLICMDTNVQSINDYTQHMRKPHTWIDTPMLLAATAVFHMQLVIIMGKAEPQLIASTCIMGHAELPVAAIARVNNKRFMALFPAPLPQGGTLDPGEGAREAHDLLGQDVLPGESHDGAEPCEEQCARTSAELPQAHDTWDLFALAEQLAQWAPWGPSASTELSLLSKKQDGDNLQDVAANVFQVLQWRNCVKLQQWEKSERHGDVSRDHVYRVAKRYHSALPVRHGGHKQFAKSGRLCGKLCLKKISDSVAQPCEKGGPC